MNGVSSLIDQSLWEALSFPDGLTTRDLGLNLWAVVVPPSPLLVEKSKGDNPKGKGWNRRQRSGGRTVVTDGLRQAIIEWQAEVQALVGLGYRPLCVNLPDALPDRMFVGDHLRRFGDLLVQGQMRDQRRRDEGESLRSALLPLVGPDRWRSISDVSQQARLVHGDLVVVEERRLVFVGLSDYTNTDGVTALRKILRDFGWRVVQVRFDSSEVLFFGNAVTEIGRDTILYNAGCVDPEAFWAEGFSVVEVPRNEPDAAAALWLPHKRGGNLLLPEHCVGTRAMLEDWGRTVLPIPFETMAEHDGALGALFARFHGRN